MAIILLRGHFNCPEIPDETDRHKRLMMVRETFWGANSWIQGSVHHTLRLYKMPIAHSLKHLAAHIQTYNHQNRYCPKSRKEDQSLTGGQQCFPPMSVQSTREHFLTVALSPHPRRNAEMDGTQRTRHRTEPLGLRCHSLTCQQR